MDIAIRQSMRIIPTYVGSTDSNDYQRFIEANHSHVCGINPLAPSLVFLSSESFPRMWDQLSSTPARARNARIIPTYVGSTNSNSSHSRAGTNHSHVCGINGELPQEVLADAESFPRMWDQQFARIAA